MSSTPLLARLGDTEDQAIGRYGVPKKSSPNRTPLLEGSHELTFEYEGWHIRCALLNATDGRSYVVKQEYSKVWNAEVMRRGGSISIREFELEAILDGEASGMKWTRNPVGGWSLNPKSSLKNPAAGIPGGQNWVRTDGALATRFPGGSTVIAELPQAEQYRAQLRAIKERRARAATPKF